MPDGPMTTGSTTVSRRIPATRETIYRAFLTPDAVAAWLPPANMRGQVHAFEPREGGRLRMTLTYDDPALGPGGKSTDASDIFEGRFKSLVPDRRVVWVITFESERAAFSGEMTITWDLVDADGGTEVTARCDGIPPGIKPEDNAEGTRSSLENLAAFVASTA